MAGVAPLMTTVVLEIARASVLHLHLHLQPHQLRHQVVVAMLVALSLKQFLMKCLNTETMRDVQVMVSTLTMLSSLLHSPSMDLAPLVILILVKES